MYFNLGTLGVFDTTSPKDFVKNFGTLLISYSTSLPASQSLSENTELSESPLALSEQGERFGERGWGKGASPLDIAILVSQLQKAFTDIRKSVTKDVIKYLDLVSPDDINLRMQHAIYQGMEIGISHKVDPSYPNIRDYDQRPDDLPTDIAWQSLASMQSAYAYYKRITEAYKELIDARIETIVAHHPNQKCVEAIQEAFVVTIPKEDTTLPKF